METIGQILKNAREKKGLTIEELASSTFIVAKFIKALEDEQFDLLPGEIYVKGFIKNLSDNDITEKVQSIAVDTKGDKRKSKPVHYDDVTMGQMTLSDTVKDEDIIQELKEIDITNLTPMDAMNTLYRLQNKLNNRWSV